MEFPTGMSDTMVDAPPLVIRAHAIADTIRALQECEAFAVLQVDQRDAVARALRVPALWIEAAQDRENVSLGLIHEFNEWFRRLGGKEA